MEKRNVEFDNKDRAKEAVEAYKESGKFDPEGSYSGKPNDKDQKPTQDADDI